MNFDYFVERGTILTEMARVSSAFAKYPEVQSAYNDLVGRVKQSGDVNLVNANTQVRNRIYTQTQDNFLDEDIVDVIKNEVMSFPSGKRREMWYRLFAPIIIRFIDSGKINPSDLIQFWNSLYTPEQNESESEMGEGSDKDSQMLNYITNDDTDEVNRLSSNLRIGVNRRMRQLTGEKPYPMSYLQYTKLASYLKPRLDEAFKLSRSKTITGKAPKNLDNQYDDVQGWIEESVDLMLDGISQYKKRYKSGKLKLKNLDEDFDETKEDYYEFKGIDVLNNLPLELLIMWDDKYLKSSADEVIKSFKPLSGKISPEKFIENMILASDKMADMKNLTASAFYKTLAGEFRDFINTDTDFIDDYIETQQDVYSGFKSDVLRRIFGDDDGMELFKAWYDFRKSLEDYNLEKLDYMKSNKINRAKDQLKSLISGTPVDAKPNARELGLTNAIVQQRNLIKRMEEDGDDTTREELKLKKMEDSFAQQKPTEIKKKNPYQKKIDDTQIRIQHAEEQLQNADPAYARELKNSISRMNAELEAYYAQASEWQPIQESVLSYMEEQTYRDSKTNITGKFVDRGYRKFDNYGKWMMFNE